MKGNRQKATEVLLRRIQSMTPLSKSNKEQYERLLSSFNDEEFHQFVLDLKEGRRNLTIVIPNKDPGGATDEVFDKIAKDLKYDFFQHIRIIGKPGLPPHMSLVKHFVGFITERRASQTLDKKISVPKNNKTIDALTGQPTGESKGARLSGMELRALSTMSTSNGKGPENAVLELIKARGGDNRARAALNAIISKHGSASLKTVNAYGSGVESSSLVSIMLACAHLKNNV